MNVLFGWFYNIGSKPTYDREIQRQRLA
jgi:hypothetical protein